MAKSNEHATAHAAAKEPLWAHTQIENTAAYATTQNLRANNFLWLI